MSRASKALVVLMVAALGLWGCSQNPCPSAAVGQEKVKQLEVRCQKLEDECQTIRAGREQVRKKLAEETEHRLKVQQELEQMRMSVSKEHEEMKQELQARTTERDTLQTNVEQVRRSLRNLLQDMDTTTASTTGGPSLSTEPTPSPSKF